MKFSIKLCALLTAFCMLITSVPAFAQNSPAASAAAQILFPSEFGQIETQINHAGKTIFYIQDAHDSLEAQQNIAKLIRHFVEHRGVKTVFEEGYEGPVPMESYFGFMEDKRTREKLAGRYLEEMRIGGAEYAHITRRSDFRLIGADSLSLYFKNIQAYRDMAGRREETLADLNMLAAEIKNLAKLHFPREMNVWITEKERFDSGTLGLPEYLKRTAERDLRLLENFPNLKTVYLALKNKNGFAVNQVQNLRAADLFTELQNFEKDYARFFLKNKRDLRIFDYLTQVLLLQKLARFQMADEEFDALRARLSLLKTKEIAAFIAAEGKKSIALSQAWETNIQPAVQFYELAHARNQAIEKAFAEFLKNPSEKEAVLVYGGFHKAAIQALLEKHGFSYAIISPKISASDEKYKSLYRSRMASAPMAMPSSTIHAARGPWLLLEPDARQEIRRDYERVLSRSETRNPNRELIYKTHPQLRILKNAWSDFLEKYSSDREKFLSADEGGPFVPSSSEWVEQIGERWFLKSSSHVLDVGSGNGLTALAFHVITGAEVTSIEIDSKRYEVLQNFLDFLRSEKKLAFPKVHFQKADFLEFPLKGFDLVYFYFASPLKYKKALGDKIITRLEKDLPPETPFVSPNFYQNQELKPDYIDKRGRGDFFSATGLHYEPLFLPLHPDGYSGEGVILTRRSEMRSFPQNFLNQEIFFGKISPRGLQNLLPSLQAAIRIGEPKLGIRWYLYFLMFAEPFLGLGFLYKVTRPSREIEAVSKASRELTESDNKKSLRAAGKRSEMRGFISTYSLKEEFGDDFVSDLTLKIDSNDDYMYFGDQKAVFKKGWNRFVFPAMIWPDLHPSRVYKIMPTISESEPLLEEIRRITFLQKAGVKGIPQIVKMGVTNKGGLWVELDGIEKARSLDQEIFGRTDRFFTVFIKIAEIIQAAHEAGIIHKDIKPENILINSQSDVEVIDWADKVFTTTYVARDAEHKPIEDNLAPDTDIYSFILTFAKLLDQKAQAAPEEERPLIAEIRDKYLFKIFSEFSIKDFRAMFALPFQVPAGIKIRARSAWPKSMSEIISELREDRNLFVRSEVRSEAENLPQDPAKALFQFKNRISSFLKNGLELLFIALMIPPMAIVFLVMLAAVKLMDGPPSPMPASKKTAVKNPGRAKRSEMRQLEPVSIIEDIRKNGALVRQWNAREEDKRFNEISDTDLRGLAEDGFNVLWMSMAWEIGEFTTLFNKMWDRNRVGSGFSIKHYGFNPDLGEDAAFDDFTLRANDFGLKIIVDIVPNHMAVDSSWIEENPEYFLSPNDLDPSVSLALGASYAQPLSDYYAGGQAAFIERSFYQTRLQNNPFVLAHGRHTSGPWLDTVQLKMNSPLTRKKLMETMEYLLRLTRGGGFRIDAIDRTTPKAFKEIWGLDMDDFWAEAFPVLKEKYPDALLIPETFWGDEAIFQRYGADFPYDMGLFRRLVDGDNPDRPLADYLTAQPFDGSNVLRFLENNDSPTTRVAARMSREKQIAAALILFAAAPGAILIHGGQMQGRSKEKPSAIYLTRNKEDETYDPVLEAAYKKFMRLFKRALFRYGKVEKIEGSYPPNLVAVKRTFHEEAALVFINYSDVPVPVNYTPAAGFWNASADAQWHDLLNNEVIPFDQLSLSELKPFESRVLLLHRSEMRAAPEYRLKNILARQDVKRIPAKNKNKVVPASKWVRILNAKGEKTKWLRDRKYIHIKGDWHAAAAVLFTYRGNVILAKLSSRKKRNTSKLQFAIHGHVGEDEEVLDAAIREGEEETGLKLRKNQLKRRAAYSEKYLSKKYKNKEHVTVFHRELSEEQFRALRPGKQEMTELVVLPAALFKELLEKNPALFTKRVVNFFSKYKDGRKLLEELTRSELRKKQDAPADLALQLADFVLQQKDGKTAGEPFRGAAEGAMFEMPLSANQTVTLKNWRDAGGKQKHLQIKFPHVYFQKQFFPKETKIYFSASFHDNFFEGKSGWVIELRLTPSGPPVYFSVQNGRLLQAPAKDFLKTFIIEGDFGNPGKRPFPYRAALIPGSRKEKGAVYLPRLSFHHSVMAVPVYDAFEKEWRLEIDALDPAYPEKIYYAFDSVQGLVPLEAEKERRAKEDLFHKTLAEAPVFKNIREIYDWYEILPAEKLTYPGKRQKLLFSAAIRELQRLKKTPSFPAAAWNEIYAFYKQNYSELNRLEISFKSSEWKTFFDFYEKNPLLWKRENRKPVSPIQAVWLLALSEKIEGNPASLASQLSLVNTSLRLKKKIKSEIARLYADGRFYSPVSDLSILKSEFGINADSLGIMPWTLQYALATAYHLYGEKQIARLRDEDSEIFPLTNSKHRRWKGREGLAMIAELAQRPGKHDFSQDLKLIKSMVGTSIGTARKNGAYHFSLARDFLYSWPATSEGYAGTIIGAGLINKMPAFTVKFTKENEEPIYSSYRIGPFQKHIPGRNEQQGSAKAVWRILHLEALDEMLNEPWNIYGEKLRTFMDESLPNTEFYRTEPSAYEESQENELFDDFRSVIEKYHGTDREIALSLAEGASREAIQQELNIQIADIDRVRSLLAKSLEHYHPANPRFASHRSEMRRQKSYLQTQALRQKLVKSGKILIRAADLPLSEAEGDELFKIAYAGRRELRFIVYGNTASIAASPQVRAFLKLPNVKTSGAAALETVRKQLGLAGGGNAVVLAKKTPSGTPHKNMKWVLLGKEGKIALARLIALNNGALAPGMSEKNGVVDASEELTRSLAQDWAARWVTAYAA